MQRPRTLNRRISSLSAFFKYLHGAASELRLPITVPNPAHAQFIARETPDPVEETKALSLTRARQLMALPGSESVLDHRDRAILKLFIYSGIRLATGCRMLVEDFHLDEGEATMRLNEKGDKRRTIGLNPVAAQAIDEYIRFAGLTSGPLLPSSPLAWLREAGGSRDERGDALPGDPKLSGAAARRLERNHQQGRQTPPALHLHAPFAARHQRHAAARRHRRYPQGPGVARSPARHDYADL